MSFLPGAQLIVVDSGSDDSLELIRAKFPDIEAFRVVNHSMANTLNEGLKRANRPNILQMNADVYLEEKTVPSLLAVLSQKNVGMVGPLCKNAQGKLQNQGFLYKRYFSILKRMSLKSISVNWLSGACMLFKSEALKQIGGMNSSLRFYNEDIEWSWRFQKAGWQCRLVNTCVTHLGGSSTPKNPKFIIEGYRGGYLISRWYKPKIYQWLHKQVVLFEARQKRNHPDLVIREAYQEIYLRFQQNNFDDSPFDKTLN